MTLPHRHLHQWNHWLNQFLGKRLLETEQHHLARVLNKQYGKHVLLIGVEHQHDLLKAVSYSHPVIISPHIHKLKNISYVESEFNQLPIMTAGVDLVLVPHTFEFIDNPQLLLQEACRVVKPEGYIIIFGFNPHGLWSFHKLGKKLSPSTIKKWLNLADFELKKQDVFLFRPPLNHPNAYQKLNFLEPLGKILYYPLGGVYMIMGQAKVIPLTPIKLKWQQQISKIGLPLRPTTGMFR